MSNSKAQKEELEKLENEAYLELCQIIAEAMQYQDKNLLDARIASWKSKYKKLLDSSSNVSSNFKKKIEFLLTQYYSEITQYILSQIKIKEEKEIKNQAKALRELYSIIKETDDLALLKDKVKKWQEKYPISLFLKMYQRRIECLTRTKNIEANAFDQEEAFKDLVDITKINGSFDELKKALSDWEEKYSIHDKYELDDFIKHQSEVKRYTSDEFLESIAEHEGLSEFDIFRGVSVGNTTNTTLQAAAYKSLISLLGNRDNIDGVFEWVYKYNSIKFDNKYRELILNAIYLDYNPTYLNYLNVPDINIDKSLSFSEFTNIEEIKKYSVISYFNLLLPPDRAVSNNNFNKYLEEIYHKSKAASFTSDEVKKDPIKPVIEEEHVEEVFPVKEHSTEHSTFEISDSEEENQEIKDNLNKISNGKNVVEESSLSTQEPEQIKDFSLGQSSKEVNNEESKEDSTTVVSFSSVFFSLMHAKSVAQKKQSEFIVSIDNTVNRYLQMGSKGLNNIKLRNT